MTKLLRSIEIFNVLCGICFSGDVSRAPLSLFSLCYCSGPLAYKKRTVPASISSGPCSTFAGKKQHHIRFIETTAYCLVRKAILLTITNFDNDLAEMEKKGVIKSVYSRRKRF